MLKVYKGSGLQQVSATGAYELIDVPHGKIWRVVDLLVNFVAASKTNYCYFADKGYATTQYVTMFQGSESQTFAYNHAYPNDVWAAHGKTLCAYISTYVAGPEYPSYTLVVDEYDSVGR